MTLSPAGAQRKRQAVDALLLPSGAGTVRSCLEAAAISPTRPEHAVVALPYCTGGFGVGCVRAVYDEVKMPESEIEAKAA